jgi:pyrroloquinoline quinone (PQQ) biosynthesis protein C
LDLETEPAIELGSHPGDQLLNFSLRAKALRAYWILTRPPEIAEAMTASKGHLMRIHFQQLTEPIFTLLDRYRAELLAHPMLEAARRGALSDDTLHEFAFHQYTDSITWIPMLAQMKSKATRSRRLQQAIRDNIAHEAGLDGTSHVTLAVELMRSLGLTALDAFPTERLADTATMWLSESFADFSEPEIAGWLLTAETLVPLMFAAIKPCYDRLGDTRYFAEHIAVDADEHAAWMAEAVDEVVGLYGPTSVPDVTTGMTDAWQETIAIPDELWGRLCASP